MKFLVMSEREILKYNVKEAHIIISIRSPKTLKLIIPRRQNCLAILYLEFHDLDGKHYPSGKAEYKLISPSDAKKVWEFVNTYKDKIQLIICQCGAGISRSAGVAAALSKALNDSDEYIFKHYLPNMLVYSLLLKEIYGENDWLGKELEFITFLYKYKNFIGSLKRKDFNNYPTREEALRQFELDKNKDLKED